MSINDMIDLPAIDCYSVVVVRGDHEEAICKCFSNNPVDVLYALAVKLGYSIRVSSNPDPTSMYDD